MKMEIFGGLIAGLVVSFYVYAAALHGQLLPVGVAIFVGGPVTWIGYKLLNVNKHKGPKYRRLEQEHQKRYEAFLNEWYDRIGLLLAIGDYESKALDEATLTLMESTRRGYNLDDDSIRAWYFEWATDPEIYQWVRDYRTIH